MSTISNIRDPMAEPILPLDVKSQGEMGKAFCLILILIFLIMTASTGNVWLLIPTGIFIGIGLYLGREKKYDPSKDPILQNFIRERAHLDKQFKSITESLRGNLPEDREVHSIEQKVRRYENERLALRNLLWGRETPFSLQEQRIANRFLRNMSSILDALSPPTERSLQLNKRIREIETSLEKMHQQPNKHSAAIAKNQKLIEKYQKELEELSRLPHS